MGKAARGSTLLAVATLGYALAGVAWFAVALWRNRRFFHDDAFISLRYARHLASGDGLVWNVGEPVEGYTNFLHVVLSAVLLGLGCEATLAVRLVNGVGVVFLVAGVYVAVRALLPEQSLGRTWAVGLAALTLSSFPLAVWTLGGLEAPLFCGLLALGLAACVRAKSVVPGAVALVLATMTRPEGVLVFSAAALCMVLDRREGWRKRCGWFFGVATVMVVPWLIWKLVYYGSILPNTFYAKAVGVGSFGPRFLSGLSYVWGFASLAPWLPILGGLGLLLAGVLRNWDRTFALLGVSVLAGVAYLGAVGGDHMPAFRLALLLLPLAPVAIALGVRALGERLPASAAHLGLAVLLGSAGLQLGDRYANPIRRDSAAFVGAIVGEHVAASFPAGTLIALSTAGSTPFFAPEHRFLDMLGLNDPTIARRQITRFRLRRQRVPGHGKGDGRYVLSRRPDYIVLGPAHGTAANRPWFLSDLELAESPEFRRDYQMRAVRIDVRDRDGYIDHVATQRGFLEFVYYERRK